ncbi:ABC transporter permease [Lactiplantibacillus paraplantarum]|uniref:ABC transporter permease n=1 Tax=Lactiplantibacillus paraplantarum TaxID=60520 RepID=A0AAD0TM25_9LACO|nr:ABC transporter permease [Lactiplantibacillus paraplantarum]AVW09160.1 ABC transporter permease [Lactiplantibacillus paraplantarum]AYJ37425.1 ABC transporter permease [Lactiplantibacillus paraplantarum]ERL45194.1 ABC transporter, permease protein [Lactiplantibacillus paraplantarum]MCU4682376.1 ABC transporter permease [Lactiplantibacillus paraplantarum]MDL2060861.1 ABC transporter permease [Lactiplantibacillus paraplantarum]
MATRLFARTGLLIQFNLRRDWKKLLIWVAVLTGLFTAIAAKFDGIYGTQTALNEIVKTLKMPAMISLFGAFTAKSPYTTAKVFATEMVVFIAIFMIIMNIMVAVATSRGDEDDGLLELVRAHAVGRLAPLLAGVVELTALNGLVGILFGLGLTVAKLPGATIQGNWLIGLGLGALGWAFGMLTLLLAQVMNSASGTTMLSYVVLGIMYVARMGTDVSHPRLTWWIPFGWIEKLDAYQANQWLPVSLYLLLGIGCLSVAALLNVQRDLGAGLIEQRRGRRQASLLLRGPATLLWRQSHGVIIAWLLGNFILGASYASVFNTIGDLAKSNPMIKQLLGASALAAANRMIVKNFIAILAIVMVIVALIPAVQLMLKLVNDEQKGYLHQVYATATSRWHVWASYTGWSLITGMAVLLAGLSGMYLMGLVSMKDPINWITYWHVFCAYGPAMLVMVAVASVLTGWLPKWRYAAWAWVFYAFFSLYLGNLIDLPKWARHLTPLGFVNKVPIKALDWATGGWCLALTVLLLVVAALGYRRRDLAQ